MAKGAKRDRSRDRVTPSVERPRAQRVTGPALEIPVREVPGREVPVREVPVREVPVREVPVREVPGPAAASPSPARHLSAAVLTGAKKVKKKCCRSRPRCKGCPVVLMRAARLQESGLTGKDLKKAVKRARAA